MESRDSIPPLWAASGIKLDRLVLDEIWTVQSSCEGRIALQQSATLPHSARWRQYTRFCRCQEIFCYAQVWGTKLVRLYSPTQAQKLYPFQNPFLRNTSQVS